MMHLREQCIPRHQQMPAGGRVKRKDGKRTLREQ